MQHTHANDNRINAALHMKIRRNALKTEWKSKSRDGVEELCKRINRLRAKSDEELLMMGVPRSEIGSHVLHKLLV